MKLKNRLLIIGCLLVVIPFMLTILAYFFISEQLINRQEDVKTEQISDKEDINEFNDNFNLQDTDENELSVDKIDTAVVSQIFGYMAIVLFIIMVLNGVVVANLSYKGIVIPVKELNNAMQQIKEGNLFHILETNSKSEIGELYQNYEEMRVRFKEIFDEKFQNEEKKKELISNITHDLKTPITSIKGYVEGLVDGVADTPEKINKYVKIIYNKANEMDRLIEELTAYSGIDNNTIPYHFQKILVGEYFNDCIEEVGFDLENQNFEVHFDNLIDPTVMIMADPEQLKKVINNIINNSVKYCDKKKGIIAIRVLDAIDCVRIEIEDNGKGINQKDLSNIFDRFYRTDASRNSATGGNGLGLSIVKKIIKDHSGYIWATSRVGEGTCIHFVIKKC